MSTEGIKLAAAVFSNMQETRIKLLGLGASTEDPSKKSAHQDILLGQMLDDMKEKFQHRFMELTMGRFTSGS